MIVLTRPYKDSLKLKGIIESSIPQKCFIEPLLEIEYLEKKIEIPENSIVVFTSLNGVRAFVKNSDERNMEVITVGKSTESKALKKGFTNVRSATTDENQSANVPNLINYIIDNVERGRNIYHVSGGVTKPELGNRLKSLGYKYKREILYNAIQREFSEEFIALLKNAEISGITFFSPRTAAIFSRQIIKNDFNSYLYGITAFCFSENVIMGLYGLDLRRIYIPEVTSSENFVKTIVKAYSKKNNNNV